MKNKRLLSKIFIYAFLIVALVVAIFPIFYTLMASVKSNQELLANPSAIFPEKFIFDNYVQAWQLANFKQYTLNSVHMAFFIVVGTIITSTIAGYVFERGKFRGKDMIFAFVLSSMFVSLGSLTLYPTLMIAKFFHMNKSLWGVIIIRVLGLNVSNLFIARGYIATIPKEVDEAAKIDGCSFFGIYRHIMFPLLKPLIATVGILEFRNAWNDYMMPLVFTMASPKRMPLVVGVVNLKSTGEAASNWNVMLAGTAISIIPMIIVFLLFNKNFISGLTAGSVKG
ncbi:MAG TPA: carbohydrate ABC transporter permease [Lachnoclostridium sp.]|jgi:ABC-type glycerol-3-phosphate transport system permease component|uniref:carbohydrate ABC transporter permease n=1 Tax=Lacrimispora sp. TaxID=2719234 RepID=UPI000EBB05E6|nr:carbohydrate ABC transporter permease [Lacrimispora sp.]HCD42852.1 carbohydrate ABC transporter permease [Lachnoclostridium sp.]